MPIVQRPLAAVIAADRSEVQRPRDLEGRTVGVTGLPSDDAVLDSVVAADGGDPSQVHRVTIGFNAVADLRAGKLDAATAFWNAEGVALRRAGVPIKEFRVDDYGAPRYPELVLVTSAATLRKDRSLVDSVVRATTRGYVLATADRATALQDLLAANPALDRDEQAAELRALDQARAFVPAGRFSMAIIRWPKWEAEHGIVDQPPDLNQMLDFTHTPRARLIRRKAGS
jgi:NitT/TauT family transport system substrate-binding protein/putative hydroxymethylpyrimidine transport system substrate-binding protein